MLTFWCLFCQPKRLTRLNILVPTPSTLPFPSIWTSWLEDDPSLTSAAHDGAASSCSKELDADQLLEPLLNLGVDQAWCFFFTAGPQEANGP